MIINILNFTDYSDADVVTVETSANSQEELKERVIAMGKELSMRPSDAVEEMIHHPELMDKYGISVIPTEKVCIDWRLK